MDKLGDFIDGQAWLKPVETVLGVVAESAFNKLMPFSQKVRNFLHGVWLGHPLHPVITDIPLGAWTVAALLDTYELSSGDGTFASGADMAVGIGLIGASGAAVTGLNDWNATSDRPRRVGALHAVVNIAATTCYAVSWWQRRNGCRRAGLTSALAGYALSLGGAYLGGHLVYSERIGVNHAPENLPSKFVPLMPEAELPENKLCRGEADGIPVVIVRRGKKIFALAEKCSHLGGPLSEGKFDRRTVTCPWHGSTFALADGSVINGPATCAQPCFQVRIRAGQIEVRAARGLARNSR